MKRMLLVCTALAALPAAATAATGDSVTAKLQGEGISGTVTMTETASGAIHVVAEATGVPEGVHGFHVHETGDCGDNFKAAGGHLAADLKHGVGVKGGPHPGDMPNVHVQSDGVLAVEYFTYGFVLNESGNPYVLDDDGSAIILHAGADDYSSQPSGDAGDRIACGVIEAE